MHLTRTTFAVALTAACGGVVGTSQGGNDREPGAVSPPRGGGPALVTMPEGYAIDSTEVTRDQYAAWLAGGPTASGQSPWCAWNDTFRG